MRDKTLPTLISVWLIGLMLINPALAEPRVPLAPAVAASSYLKDMRRQMIAGRELSNSDLRQLADAGEGLAAARFAKRLEAKGDPAMLAEAAHYYSIAVYADRDFALPRLIALLGRDDVVIRPARLKLMLKVLERQVQQQDSIAAAVLANLLLRGQPFGQDIPRARDLLLVAAKAGDTVAAMRLAMSHFQGTPGLPPDPEAARPALALALASPDPGVQAMATTLLLRLPEGAPLLTALAPAEPTLRPRARPLTGAQAVRLKEGSAP